MCVAHAGLWFVFYRMITVTNNIDFRDIGIDVRTKHVLAVSRFSESVTTHYAGV